MLEHHKKHLTAQVLNLNIERDDSAQKVWYSNNQNVHFVFDPVTNMPRLSLVDKAGAMVQIQAGVSQKDVGFLLE